MRRTFVRRTVTAVTTGLLLTGLTAISAVAAPGDPVPGWAPRPEEAHREVAVSDQGRVFVSASNDPGYNQVNYLEVGYFEDWVRTPNAASPFGSHLATGPNGYAVSISYNTYRLYDGSAWSDRATFYEGSVRAVDMDANLAGDVSVLLRLAPDGGTVLARLPRGGEWTVQEVPGVSTDVPADVVLNEQGKTTVVWAVSSGERATILRSVVHAGRTDWSSPQTVGTVNHAEPNLSIVSDGQGRETIIGGNRVWRQPITSRPPEYRMNTSSTPDGRRRLGHPRRLARRDRGRLRGPLGDVLRRGPAPAEHPVVAHQAAGPLRRRPFRAQWDPPRRRHGPRWPVVRRDRHRARDRDRRRVPGRRVAPPRRPLRPGPRRGAARLLRRLGGEFQVDAAAAGPVAVEFKNWDDRADPIGGDQPDGLYSLSFHRADPCGSDAHHCT